jgi:hypothetical protein
MTQTARRRADSAATDLLSELFAAVRPIVDAAAKQQGTTAPQTTTALLVASPKVAVFVEHRDNAGSIEKVFRAPGRKNVAERLGRFIVHGLNEAVTPEVRQQVGRLMDAGAVVALRLHFDIIESATATLLAGDDEVDLFTLQIGESH